MEQIIVTQQQYKIQRNFPSDSDSILLKPDSMSAYHKLHVITTKTQIIELITSKHQNIVDVHQDCKITIEKLNIEISHERALNAKLLTEKKKLQQLLKQFKKLAAKRLSQIQNISVHLFLSKAQLARMKETYNELNNLYQKVVKSTVSKDLIDQYNRKIKDNEQNFNSNLQTLKKDMMKQQDLLRYKYQKIIQGINHENQRKINKFMTETGKKIFSLKTLAQTLAAGKQNLEKQKGDRQRQLQKIKKQYQKHQYQSQSRISSLLKDLEDAKNNLELQGKQNLMKMQQLGQGSDKIKRDYQKLKIQNEKMLKLQQERLNEIENLKKRLKQLQNKQNQLKFQLKKLQNLLQGIKKELDKYKNDVIQLKQINNNLELEIQKLKKQKNDLQSKLKQIINKYEKAINDHAKCESLINNNLKQIKIISQQKQQLAKNYQGMKAKCMEKQKEFNDLNIKFKNLLKQYQKLQGEFDQLQKENNKMKHSLQDEIQYLKKKIAQAQNEFQKKLKNKEQYIKQKETQNLDLLNKIRLLQKTINQYLQQIQNMKRKLKSIPDLQNKLAQKDIYLAQANKLNNQLNKSLKNLKNQLQNKNRQIFQLMEKIKGLQILKNNLSAQNQKLHFQLRKLNEELQKLKNRQKHLLKQIQDLKLIISQLENQRNKFKQTIEQYTQIITQMRNRMFQDPQLILRYKKLLLEYANRIAFLQNQLDNLLMMYRDRCQQLNIIKISYNQSNINQIKLQLDKYKALYDVIFYYQQLRQKQISLLAQQQRLKVIISKKQQELIIKTKQCISINQLLTQKLNQFQKVPRQKEKSLLFQTQTYLIKLKELQKNQTLLSSLQQKQTNWNLAFKQSRQIRDQKIRGSSFPRVHQMKQYSHRILNTPREKDSYQTFGSEMKKSIHKNLKKTEMKTQNYYGIPGISQKKQTIITTKQQVQH